MADDSATEINAISEVTDAAGDTDQQKEEELASAFRSEKVRFSSATKVLPGDEGEIELYSVYDVLKSYTAPSGYKYVTESKRKGWWQAYPYRPGVIKGNRWHAGNWATPLLAAKAVAIATLHRCGARRVEVIMSMLDESCYQII